MSLEGVEDTIFLSNDFEVFFSPSIEVFNKDG